MTPGILLRVNGIDPDGASGAPIIKALDAAPTEIAEQLIAFASRFRTAGGAWSATEVANMHPVEREACIVAGERLIAASALWSGKAASGPLGAAHVASLIDGGAQMRELDENVTEMALDDLRTRAREVLARRAATGAA